MKKQLTIQDLSEHLFWDVDKTKLDFEKHKAYVIQRVLEYGNFNDWKTIRAYYGKSKIKEAVLSLRTLDPFSLSYVANYINVPKTEMRCYKHAQLHPNCWNSFID